MEAERGRQSDGQVRGVRQDHTEMMSLMVTSLVQIFTYITRGGGVVGARGLCVGGWGCGSPTEAEPAV